MSKNTYYQLDYHLVFSTKHRQPWINHDVLEKMRNICAQMESEMGFKIHILNGYLDHIHILLSIPPRLAIADVAKRIKGRTSFEIGIVKWQTGYSVFVVEKRSFLRIFKYIKNQEKHHQNTDDSDQLEYF